MKTISLTIPEIIAYCKKTLQLKVLGISQHGWEVRSLRGSTLCFEFSSASQFEELGNQIQWNTVLKMETKVPQGVHSFCKDAANCGGGVFVDLENMSSLKTREFVETSPLWRMIGKGLNIEGICENWQCEAHGRRVVCPKGFVVFNLNDPKGSVCPICHTLVKPLTCSFSDCMWMFEGRKALPLSPSKSPPDVVSWWYNAQNRYEYFDVTNNMVGWASLVIVAKKRMMPATTRARPRASQPSLAKSLFKCFGLDELMRTDEPCPICFGKQDKRSSVHKTSCGHFFHKECVCLWKASGGTTCPMCREYLLEFA